MSSGTAAPAGRVLRGRPRLRRPRFRRQRIRLAVAVTVLLALVLTAGWFLLRDSPLVSVDHVTVTGVGGADAPAIRSALRSAARKMTTLDVQTAQLRAAVSRFPEVKELRVSTQLPHGIVIQVVELLPVAEVQVGGRKVQVTGEGRLLPARRATESLPLIPLPDPPSGGRLTQPWAIAAARLLGAAPYRLLPRVEEVTTVAGHGLVAKLRDGPSIYFGGATQAAPKWAAVLAVLANSNSEGASYIDVTDPQHPAAGSTAAAGSATSSGATGGSGTGTTVGTGAGTTASGATSGASPGTGISAGGSGTPAGTSGATVSAAASGPSTPAGAAGTTTPASASSG